MKITYIHEISTTSFGKACNFPKIIQQIIWERRNKTDDTSLLGIPVGERKQKGRKSLKKMRILQKYRKIEILRIK